jgi:hypothetical protein
MLAPWGADDEDEALVVVLSSLLHAAPRRAKTKTIATSPAERLRVSKLNSPWKSFVSRAT